MLEQKEISIKLKEYRQIKDLMKKSFSKDELLPSWLLLLLANRDFVDYLAYYDDKKLIGLSYQIRSDVMDFVFYLVVNEKVRSMGYGSEILNLICKENTDREIVLSIEPLDVMVDNYVQRKRRYDFYLKNGFNDTGFYIDDDSKYLILSNKKIFNQEECKRLLKRYSYDMYDIRFKKKSNF